MSYTLYTAEKCHDCKTVANFLVEKSIPHTNINFDKDNACPPFDLHIFPALFNDGKLVAYGIDIINYLKRASQV